MTHHQEPLVKINTTSFQLPNADVTPDKTTGVCNSNKSKPTDDRSNCTGTSKPQVSVLDISPLPSAKLKMRKRKGKRSEIFTS